MIKEITIGSSKSLDFGKYKSDVHITFLLPNEGLDANQEYIMLKEQAAYYQDQADRLVREHIAEQRKFDAMEEGKEERLLNEAQAKLAAKREEAKVKAPVPQKPGLEPILERITNTAPGQQSVTVKNLVTKEQGVPFEQDDLPF